MIKLYYRNDQDLLENQTLLQGHSFDAKMYLLFLHNTRTPVIEKWTLHAIAVLRFLKPPPPPPSNLLERGDAWALSENKDISLAACGMAREGNAPNSSFGALGGGFWFLYVFFVVGFFFFESGERCPYLAPPALLNR